MNRSRRSPSLPRLGACLALSLSLAVAPWVYAATPVERHQAWVGSLQAVLDSDLGLSPEEVSALHAAIVSVDASDFTDRLGRVERERLNRHAGALVDTLSCDAYGAVVEGFGDLTPWLAENEVVVAEPKCNCGSDAQCSSGYYCQDIECTSEVGTRNWGRCAEGPKPIEPETVDP